MAASDVFSQEEVDEQYPDHSPTILRTARSLPSPVLSPTNGTYSWSRQTKTGGVRVCFHLCPNALLDHSTLHWRFEWSRTGYLYGMKFSGFTSNSSTPAHDSAGDNGTGGGDFTSNFRIADGRMGFVRRERGAAPWLELELPGRYVVQAWSSDVTGRVSSVTTRTYEVIQLRGDHDVGAGQQAAGDHDHRQDSSAALVQRRAHQQESTLVPDQAGAVRRERGSIEDGSGASLQFRE